MSTDNPYESPEDVQHSVNARTLGRPGPIKQQRRLIAVSALSAALPIIILLGSLFTSERCAIDNWQVEIQYEGSSTAASGDPVLYQGFIQIDIFAGVVVVAFLYSLVGIGIYLVGVTLRKFFQGIKLNRNSL